MALNAAHLQSFDFAEILKLLYKPLPLDVSTACYLIAIPFLFNIIFFTANYSSQKLFNSYLFVSLFLVNFLSAIDVVIYREMGVKIHFKLFSHLQHPAEVLQTVQLKYWLIGLLLIFVFTFFHFKLLKKIIGQWNEKSALHFLKRFLFSVFILLSGAFLLIVGIRGGLQPIPINESEVYFSKNNFLNEAAVNPSWALLHSYIENKKVLSENPYRQMSDAEAKKIVADLFKTEKDSTVSILQNVAPNVVFIIMESWSADVIESLNGLKNITPNFEKLIGQGVLFKNCYASGTLSDQGIPSVLSAYPAQPVTSIIANPEKYPRMNCINQNFKKHGYNTSFYFGGQLIYGNIKSYLYYFDFDEIKEQKDFSGLPSGRLGIHDSLMLQIWLQDLNKKKQPFFSTLFTLSTHPPYDEPMPTVITEGGNLQPYLNSIHYTDRSFARFFEAAKKTEWFKNTLFVMVSDHSHDSPLNFGEEHAAKHCHIPLLFFGEAIKPEWRGKVIEKTCSQNDVVATVLHQLNWSSKEFNWSKNVLNPYTKDFAYYSFTEGGGFVTNTAEARWEKIPNTIIAKGDSTLKSKNEKNAKAYLQTLMNEYLSF